MQRNLGAAPTRTQPRRDSGALEQSAPTCPEARGESSQGGRRAALLIALAALVAAATAGTLLLGNTSLGSADWTWLRVGMVTLFALSALALGWRLWLVGRYRPVPPPPLSALPLTTVIVPAYNEGRSVYDALDSLNASDYPRHQLQIVAIDDGSRDDTWTWLMRARRDFGVEVVRFSENRGKRHALYEGMRRARGEFVVTVDGDSAVRPDTLRHLVAPLIANTDVGAVAGTVRVLNRTALIGRMLDVSFTYAFQFIRASESMLGAVVCCPGALSAYRRSILDRVKDRWLNQTLFGVPANIGEDRALTNHTLRLGYRVVLQSTALVYTDVPTSFGKLWRMLLRWARSNVRETVVLGSFIFRRFRPGPTLGIRVLFLQHAASMLAAGLSFAPSVVVLALAPQLVLWLALGALAMAAIPCTTYAVYRNHPARCFWGLAYGLTSAFALAWIAPLALLTPHVTGWLTRGQLQPARARAARRSTVLGASESFRARTYGTATVRLRSPS